MHTTPFRPEAVPCPVPPLAAIAPLSDRDQTFLSDLAPLTGDACIRAVDLARYLYQRHDLQLSDRRTGHLLRHAGWTPSAFRKGKTVYRYWGKSKYREATHHLVVWDDTRNTWRKI